MQGEEGVDLVLTDSIASLVILSHDQTERIKKLESSRDSEVTPHSWMTVDNCAHYAKYGAAVYGFLNYAQNSPVAGWGLLKVLYKGRSEDFGLLL